MKTIYILINSALLLFYSCSASTDNRYADDKGKEESIKETESKITEDFDFTPYRTNLEIPKKEIILPTSIQRTDIWYGYEDDTDTTSTVNKKIIEKVPGYRVLVLTTDNLEEANNMKSEIYFNVTQKEVYVVFDPPFYKVMIGDFTEYSEAKDLSFKMNQLGYSESRVVNETINIFEK